MKALEHVYLEDSYFLGMTARGPDLRIRGLFALTVDHPAYTHPLAGEQHAYREGEVRFTAVSVLDLRGLEKPALSFDPDGTLDFGSLHIVTGASGIRVDTDWFNLLLTADDVSLVLDEGFSGAS